MSPVRVPFCSKETWHFTQSQVFVIYCYDIEIPFTWKVNKNFWYIDKSHITTTPVLQYKQNICSFFQIIPARSHASIVTYFTPDVKYLSSLEVTDCVGYALGYVSLADETASHPSQFVERAEMFEVEPLRLDFTANMKPAMWVKKLLNLLVIAASNMERDQKQVSSIV